MPVRSGCQGLLFAALALAFAPRGVDASCGDYVMIGGAHGGHDASADRSHQNEHRQPLRSTCQGPHCQKRLPLPSAPERGSSDSTAPQWADWRAAVLLPLLDGQYRLAEAAGDLPDNHPSPLWRPPTRLLSA